MRLMLLCQCLAALWTALALLLYVYVRSFYRLSSWTDLGTALQTARLPRVDSRCKSARLTQSNSSVEKQQQQMHGLQCLPNVLFIGASKCGTTSLVNYLAQHPQIYFVRRRINSVYNRSTATNNSSSIRSGAGAGKTTKHREIHRFDRNTFGWAWKPLDLIDEWASSPIVPNTKSVVIHYTPHYLYAPSVPFAAKAFYPHARDMKLVVMLRDPVERALSSYWFKNSHLFQQTDQGSIADFMQHFKLESSIRLAYEQCMTNSYSAWCTHNQQHCPHLCTEKNSKATTDHRSSDSQLIGTYLPSLSTLSADGKCHSMYLRFHEKQLENCFSVRRTATEFQVNGTASGSKSGHTQTMAGLLGEHWRASALGNRHIDKGIYYDQLLRWLYNFGVQTGQSRSDFQKNIHIIFTDDLKSKPQFVMQELLQFLYANGTIPDALTEVNQSWKKILEKPNSLSSRNSLSHQQKLELYKYFYRYNNFLKEVFECPYETSGNLYDNGHSTLCGRLFRMINQWNHNIQEKTEENSYQQSSNQ